MKFINVVVCAVVMASAACSGPIAPSGSPGASVDTNRVTPPSGSTLAIGDTIDVSFRVTLPFVYAWVFHREGGSPWMAECRSENGGSETRVENFREPVDRGLYTWANGKPIRLEFISTSVRILCSEWRDDFAGGTRVNVATWNLQQSP